MNEKELSIINETQNEYEDLLVSKIKKDSSVLKRINYSSPTGTGKTKMMAEVINKLNEDYFFVITTLSKGQLNHQIKAEIERFTTKTNYIVYGLSDYTKNTILQKEDILSLIPNGKRVIWFRDEGHINTNRWMEILEEISCKIVNFSATNKFNSDDDIKCNFNHTMMLRTVHQSEGEPKDAIEKLLEVKNQHKDVQGYNPCALFRVLDDNVLKITIDLCKKHKLKYINITDEEYDMSDICRDDNEYDVIINKFKITEGIDIRRAHVLYMTNEPKNPATTIQVIGRCRRNALLYRDDIDILAPENEELLKNTRCCYVYYNVQGMNIEEDENGDLVTAFCDAVSVESLKPRIFIELNNGTLSNGLSVIEADGATGTFYVDVDKQTGFNYLYPETPFYSDSQRIRFEYVEQKFADSRRLRVGNIYRVVDLLDEYNLALYKKHGYITLGATCVEKYPLDYQKGLDLFEYIKDSKVTPAYLAIERKKELPYVVHHGSVQGPKLLPSDVGNVNKYRFTTIVKKIYQISYENTKRFKTKEEALVFMQSLETNYPIPEEYARMSYFELNVIRPRYKPIIEFRYNYENPKKTEEAREKYFKFKRDNAPQIYSIDFKRTDLLGEEVFINEINDREISLLSGDMKISKRGNSYTWIEDKNVTSKVAKYTKFNIYITRKFSDILNKVEPYYYRKDNDIFKTKKFNTMFGWCVEYTSKLLFELFSQNSNCYGIKVKLSMQLKESILDYDFDKIRSMLSSYSVKAFLVKEAIDIYKAQMISVYNISQTMIPSMSYEKLIGETIFVSKVYDTALQVFNFLKEKYDLTEDNIDEKFLNNVGKCNLSVKHIYGLADYIIGDTIIDLKCTSSIDEKYMKQLLAYYWLSTKHNMDIKKIMIYEAMKNKYVLIDMETGEVNSNILI